MQRGRKWRLFENVVASVQQAEHQGAIVRWNETIRGRQFDVTVRTRIGHAEELTVIECKNTRRKVSVDKVDALVTKARDAGAAQAVMVSSAGYQDGCAAVAQRYNVDLLTLEETRSIPPEKLTGRFALAANIYHVTIETRQGEKLTLPEDLNQLPWLLKEGTLTSQGYCRSVHQAIREALSSADTFTHDGRACHASLPRNVSIALDGATIQLPDQSPPRALGSISFKLRVVQASIAKAGELDPWLLSRAYQTHDEFTGRRSVHRALALRGAPSDRVIPRHFYHDPRLAMSYYCLGIEAGVARMVLVESYQHGALMQAVFTANCEDMAGHVEVTDRAERQRLTALLARMPGLDGDTGTSAG